MPEPRIVFVLSPYQNAFFFELAEALGDALRGAGVDVATTREPGEHLVADDDVFVLLPPHEYVALEGSAFVDDERVATRTVGVSAEQPHQSFFERNAALGASLGAVLDFSALAVDAYRRHGVAALHLPMGYVPRWDRVEGSSERRTITTAVLYLGNKRPRRLSVLAAAADALARHRARLLISDNDEPNRSTGATFVVGDDKRDLLASTGLLVNVHQSDEPYFEWLRFVEAAHCGAPVLTERSTATEPFVDGTHFLSFPTGALDVALDGAMSDPLRLEGIAAAAYELLRSRPLSRSVEVLADAARALLTAPPPAALPPRTRRAPIGRDRTDPSPLRRWRQRRTLASILRPHGRRWVLVAPPGTELAADVDALADGRTPFVNVLAHGVDAGGAPMLEGLWPWQPWRLLHGQHLGRVLIVDRRLLDDAQRWFGDDALVGHPHLIVQVFAAVHGIVGGHLPTPLAALHGTPADPGQPIPDELVHRCRTILATGSP